MNSLTTTRRNNNNTTKAAETPIEDEIVAVTAQALNIRTLRLIGNDRFIDDQAIFAERQCFFLEELERLKEQTTPQQSGISRWCYTNAIREVSSFDESEYIMSKESALCQALHQVEVQTNQLRILLKYHETTVKTLKKQRDYERQTGQEINDTLRIGKKSTMIITKSLISEKKATLKQQRCELRKLRGEGETVDEEQQRLENLLLPSSPAGKLEKGKLTRRRSMEKAFSTFSSSFRRSSSRRATM